jgi:hypothetical protein
MKMAVFWVVALCNLVVVYRLFRGTCCLTLMMEAASISEMMVNFYQTIWRYNPEGSHLNDKSLARFHVLMAASMKMAVFWVIVP